MSCIQTSTVQVRTDIEISTRAGRVCRVFVYKPRYELGMLTSKEVKRGTLAL